MEPTTTAPEPATWGGDGDAPTVSPQTTAPTGALGAARADAEPSDESSVGAGVVAGIAIAAVAVCVGAAAFAVSRRRGAAHSHGAANDNTAVGEELGEPLRGREKAAPPSFRRPDAGAASVGADPVLVPGTGRGHPTLSSTLPSQPPPQPKPLTVSCTVTQPRTTRVVNYGRI